jgi:hypothetical protein
MKDRRKLNERTVKGKTEKQQGWQARKYKYTSRKGR